MRPAGRLLLVVLLAFATEALCLFESLSGGAIGGPVFCRVSIALLYPTTRVWPAFGLYGDDSLGLTVFLLLAFAEFFLPLWLASELIARRRHARKRRTAHWQREGTF